MDDFDPWAIASKQEKALLLAQALAQQPGAQQPIGRPQQLSADPTGGMGMPAPVAGGGMPSFEGTAPPMVAAGDERPPAVGQMSGIDELLASEDFMSSLAPMDAQKAGLDKQRAMAEALMGTQMVKGHSTGMGTAMGGIADLLSARKGRQMIDEAGHQGAFIDRQEAKGARNRTLLSRAQQLDRDRAGAEKDAGERTFITGRDAAGHAFTAEQNKLRETAEDKRAAQNRALQREKFGADAAADKAAADAKKEAEMPKATADLRKEFSALPDVKKFNDVEGSYKNLLAVSKKPSGAGDLSMIFSYMKMLDPGASVMEGDVANAQNAAGVPSQLSGLYNRMIRGERLSPEHRADFLAQAHNLYGSQKQRVGAIADRYRGFATKGGLNPDDVAPGFGGSAQQDGAQAGSVDLGAGSKAQTMTLDGKTLTLNPQDGKYY